MKNSLEGGGEGLCGHQQGARLMLTSGGEGGGGWWPPRCEPVAGEVERGRRRVAREVLSGTVQGLLVGGRGTAEGAAEAEVN